MKKLLSILCLLVVCCSKEHEVGLPEPEPHSIIGIWKPVRQVEVCADEKWQRFSNFSDCTQQSRLIFSGNRSSGKVEAHQHFLVDEECDGETNIEGTWTSDGNSLSITVNSITAWYPVLEIWSHTLRFGQFITEERDICEGSGRLKEEYTEYVRVTNE